MRNILMIALATAALAACGPMPTPRSNPEAARKALTSAGYTNITEIAPLNGFSENCDPQESTYCNYFVATDRRGIRVSGTVAEEIDGELEIDHND